MVCDKAKSGVLRSLMVSAHDLPAEWFGGTPIRKYFLGIKIGIRKSELWIWNKTEHFCGD
jgi:hypothetical protein